LEASCEDKGKSHLHAHCYPHITVVFDSKEEQKRYIFESYRSS